MNNLFISAARPKSPLAKESNPRLRLPSSFTPSSFHLQRLCPEIYKTPLVFLSSTHTSQAILNHLPSLSSFPPPRSHPFLWVICTLVSTRVLPLITPDVPHLILTNSWPQVPSFPMGDLYSDI